MLVRQWINFAQDGITTKACMQQHLFNHFSNSGHAGLLDDVSLTFIGTFMGTFIGTFIGTFKGRLLEM